VQEPEPQTHVEEEVSKHDEGEENVDDVHPNAKEEASQLDSYTGGPWNMTVLT